MKEENNSNPDLKIADELAEKGRRAFQSYTWKLNKSHDDSFKSSEVNPYSDDKWANDVSYPEHDLELAFDYYQQALARYEKILEPDDIKIGEMLFNCGTVSMDPMYDDIIALDFFKSALPIYMEKKPYSRDLAILYKDLGSVCLSMNDLLSSLDYYYKSLSLFNKLAICGEGEDISELKERITETENKLGLHIVHESEKCGFADKNNNIVIPCIWNDVRDFSEGFCCAKDDKDLWGYINYHGDLVIPCVYKEAYSFKNGMAFVEENVEEVFPVTLYIDDEGNHIASDFELMPHQIEAVYNADVLCRFRKYNEAAEAILPALGTGDSGPALNHLSYLALAEQYDKLIERCNRIIKYDGRSELVVLAELLLATAYEEGKGVEQDLIQAFRHFNAVRLENNISDDDYQQVDDFIKRHPGMLDLPEVQSALAPYEEDDNEDY